MSARTAQLRVVHQWEAGTMSGLRALAEEFGRLHPDVTIDMVTTRVSDWDEFHTKVLMEMAAGDPPDLVYTVTENFGMFAAWLCEPLDSYVRRDSAELRDFFSDVHPALIESSMYQGSIFQLPIEFNAADIFCNLSWFERAGLERPADDWTKDDFSEIASALAVANPDALGAFAWTNRLWGGLVPWIYAAGSNLLEEEHYPADDAAWLWSAFYPDDPAAAGRGGGWRWGAPHADDSRNVEALQFLVDMFRAGRSPKAIEAGGANLLRPFVTGTVGMAPAGGFWSGDLHRAGMGPEDYDIQFFPRWATQRHQFGTAGYVITKKARDKDLAWEWAKFTASRKGMEIAFRYNESTPSRRSMATPDRYAWSGPPHWRVFYDSLDRFPDSAPMPAPPTSAPLTTTFTKYVDLALNGTMNPKQAMSEMQQALERMSFRWYS